MVDAESPEPEKLGGQRKRPGKKPKSHTPGRGHRRKSAPRKQKRRLRQRARAKQHKIQDQAEKQRVWDALTDEQRRLLRDTAADPGDREV